MFARRSAHRLFMALACGLILADRGTVTGMAAAAGIGRQWRRACWFFAAAKWDAGVLGLAVARLIVKYLLSEGAADRGGGRDLLPQVGAEGPYLELSRQPGL